MPVSVASERGYLLLKFVMVSVKRQIKYSSIILQFNRRVKLQAKTRHSPILQATHRNGYNPPSLDIAGMAQTKTSGIHYSLCTQLLQTMRRVRQMVLLIKPYTAKSNRVYSTLT